MRHGCDLALRTGFDVLIDVCLTNINLLFKFAEEEKKILLKAFRYFDLKLERLRHLAVRTRFASDKVKITNGYKTVARAQKINTAAQRKTNIKVYFSGYKKSKQLW